jgi:hypothetical protein
MNGSQIISVAIMTLAVLTGAIVNNSRIGDIRDLVRAEMSKNHSEMLHRLADLDTRLTCVEQRIERAL